MTTKPTTPPDWFSTLIGQGLASLYLLCLDGCPAADATPAVGRLWASVLWNSPRCDWHMEADTARIRAAFAALCGTCHRWPAPAKFWEVLPARAAPTDLALPSRVFSMEERRANLRRLAEMGKELLGIEPKADEGTGP